MLPTSPQPYHTSLYPKNAVPNRSTSPAFHSSLNKGPVNSSHIHLIQGTCQITIEMLRYGARMDIKKTCSILTASKSNHHHMSNVILPHCRAAKTKHHKTEVFQNIQISSCHVDCSEGHKFFTTFPLTIITVFQNYVKQNISKILRGPTRHCTRQKH